VIHGVSESPMRDERRKEHPSMSLLARETDPRPLRRDAKRTALKVRQEIKSLENT
jgi:hypothetical protein